MTSWIKGLTLYSKLLAVVVLLGIVAFGIG
jgi:hypothetical protein